MVHISSLALALAAGALPQFAQAGLNTAAKAAGLKYFGTAVDNPGLEDKAYVKQTSNTDDFGQITPANGQKWGPTEPSEGTFTFDAGDAVVDLAESNGQILRCHNLVWHNQLPDYVSSGSWTNETLIEAMKEHITKVTTHYKGQCYAWDVVNEALNEDGTYRESIFYKTIGEAYIPIAFAAAAAADPDVKLYYNDYNIGWPGDKADGAKRIVHLLQSYGVKIDGVGMQAHLIVGQTPSQSDFESNMKDFLSLGVEAAYTEVDIRMELPSNDEKLAQQKKDYYTITKACVNTEGCVGITVWDWTDKYSWVPGVFEGYGAPLPWDKNLQKKPAYYGILSALGGGSSSGPSSSSAIPSSTGTPTTMTTSTYPSATDGGDSGDDDGGEEYCEAE